ncbi:MAG: KilA-N domain-containing protein [Verrucomicrobiota bacterium]
MNQLMLSLISHEIEGKMVHQRAVDGYFNATAMCSAVGKQFADYRRLKTTEEFLTELSSDMGIPISQLVLSFKGNTSLYRQGTWVHPDIAINLAQWLSPKFAVAVSRWVRDWMAGKVKKGCLPYHIERYMANRADVPHTHFSMLNEMIFALIAPLETDGYRLPDDMLPDISMGKMFCKWLRDEKGLDTDKLPTYKHKYDDGRVVLAKLYPNAVLPDLRAHFHDEWMPKHAVDYFVKRDSSALPHLKKLLPSFEFKHLVD